MRPHVVPTILPPGTVGYEDKTPKSDGQYHANGSTNITTLRHGLKQFSISFKVGHTILKCHNNITSGNTKINRVVASKKAKS
jgi:hypothetical protein